MKTHRILLVLILVAATWTWWRQTHPTMLTVFTGRTDERAIELMRVRGANFELTSRGFRLACDQAAFEAIFDMMKFHQMAAELCTQNMANAQTSKTADGTPYRRKLLVMGEGGVPIVQISNEDFNWVYDPSNPNAEQENDHKGYVAMPNVNLLTEMSALRQHQKLADSYEAVLQRFEAQRPDLVIFKCATQPPVEEQPAPRLSPSTDFESLLQSVSNSNS